MPSTPASFSTQADEELFWCPSFASRVAGVLIYAAIDVPECRNLGVRTGGSVAWDHGRSGRPEALGMCGRRKREPVRQAQARVSSHSHDVVPRSVAGLQYRGAGGPIFATRYRAPQPFPVNTLQLGASRAQERRPFRNGAVGGAFDLCQTGNGALVKLFAAAFAAFRADFDQIIGLCEEIEVVLDDDDRVALVDEAV